MSVNQIMNFQVVSDYQPKGDQPLAIDKLSQGIVDGEKLTIADMIEDITDSGEIVLRDDISVRAKSSIPRLEDLLKEKYELNQSRILQNVPLTDGTRRDMTQAEYDIMLRKDRDRKEQAQLLKQAQLQAGSGYNVQTPTMFK